MGKAFALDLAGNGMRSDTIAPTFIEMPMTRPFFADAAFKASVLTTMKLGRLGTVEDRMSAVVFLGSDAGTPMTAPASLSTAAGPRSKADTTARRV